MASHLRLRQLSVLALVAALSGCAHASGTATGASAPNGTTSPSAASSSPGPSATASQTPAQLGHTLESIAIKAADLASGYKMRLYPGGDQVKGQVTLDNCGYDFTTEGDRLARRQYAVVDAGQDTGLSNELVAYATAAEASKALAQWHAAAAHCPHTTVHSNVAGVPPMIETIRHNQLDLGALPVKHNAATYMSAVVKGEGTEYNISILQVQGRFLDNIYLNSDRPFTARESDVAFTLATITGKRLAALAGDGTTV